MSVDHISEHAQGDVIPEAGEARRDQQVVQGWRVDRSIPAAPTDTQLAAILDIGLTGFYERKKAGHFTFLELKPQLPNSNTRYSGALVSRWLAGEDLTVTPSRRFFGKGSSATVLPMPTRKGRRPGRPRKSGSQQSVAVR